MKSDEFKFAIHEVMKSPDMRELYTKTPMLYQMSERDIVGTNDDSIYSQTLNSVKEGYGQIVPSSWQDSFTIANIRFIKPVQLDIRNQNNVYSTDQLVWLEIEIEDAFQKN